MFVIPLGLQAKTRDLPWLTLAIFAATCAYSWLYMGLDQRLARQHYTSEAVQERLHKAKPLAIAACPILKPKHVACERLNAHLQPDKIETLRGFESRLNRELAPMSGQYIPHLIAYVVANENWHRPSLEIRQLREYAAYEAANQKTQQEMTEFNLANGLLSKATLDLITVMRAQFLHGGFMHLIGNMVFLLIFAFAVEQRIGSFGLSLVYLLGGALGLAFHILLESDPSRVLLGASAGVFAVGGAFMTLFWSKKMRAWVSAFFVYNRVVLIPTWLFFGVFILTQEFSGVLQPVSTPIAHLAHLGGFAAGSAFTLLFMMVKPVKAPFVFPFESDLYKQCLKEQMPAKRLGVIRHILFYNPTNEVALVEGWRSVLSLPSLKWETLPKRVQSFLKENFSSLIRYQLGLDQNDIGREEFFKTLQQVNWPWVELVPKAESVHLFRQSKQSMSQNRSGEAATLYWIALAIDPKGQHWSPMRAAVERLYKELNDANRKAAV